MLQYKTWISLHIRIARHIAIAFENMYRGQTVSSSCIVHTINTRKLYVLRRIVETR